MDKSSKIIIEIVLDEKKIPEKISWTSEDQDLGGKQEAKAMMLSLFADETKETMRLDLWTKSMEVMEMDQFYYHSIKAMADSYARATGNHKMASAMQQLAQYFGEETKLIKPKG